MNEFVPRVAPTYAAPKHLSPLVEALELSWTQSVRRTCHAPPRHGKTDTLLAFVALSLLRHPELTVAFISYEADVAKSKSRKARMWAEAAGVKLAEDSRRLNEWRTVQGGGLLAGGVGGPLTGQGVNCFVGDTLVTTQEGVMTIEELVCRGESAGPVQCYDRQRQQNACGNLVATKSSYAEDICEVVTCGGRKLRCTPEHQIFVFGRGWKSAYELHRGDKLILSDGKQDAVWSWRFLDEGAWVYDIQIGYYKNFFANDILVHNCLIVDDPYKNRLQAESAAYRSMVADWWNDVAETRIEPGGSAIVCHTRWLHDDLIGHIYSGAGASIWEHINLPALSEDGKALWPERWDAEALEAKRLAVGEYTWASLYQGEPRPRGGAVFEGDVVTYSALPTDNVRYAIGVDLAYSERTSSDYSVAVVVARSGDDYYVVDILRLQCSAPTFAARLKALCGQYTGAQLRWYASGTELAAAQFFRTHGVPIVALNPKGDKFTRAMPIAAAWNRGAVRIARRPWADDFINELRSFTGVRDPHDDQVDALAAAFDALAVERPRVRRPEAAITDFDEAPIG